MKNGWQRKQLGELAELKGRIGWRGLTAKEYTKQGPLFLSVHSLNYGDYVDFRDAFHISEERYAESPEIMLQSNDILICKDGAGIGKLGILGEIPDRATINSSLLLIRSGKYILPKYLYHCLTSPYFQDIVQSRLNGATTPHLYQRDITEFPVVLPPLAEQQRIVGLLDEAFEGLATAKANAEKNLQNARELFESRLQSVFTQRGPGWVDRTLGDLIEIQNGYAFKSTDYTDAGYFVIRISNVQDGEITLANPRFIKLADKNLERFILNDGDILISLTGNIGRVGIIQEGQLPAVLNQRVARMTIKDQSADRDFLFRFLLSRTFRESLQEAGHGAAQQNVSTKEIEAVQLSLPNKKEQRRIADEFDEFAEETQRLARLYERKLAALEELKKSLLHQAFMGEL
jgi:type I restriction enzyme, S subunit